MWRYMGGGARGTRADHAHASCRSTRSARSRTVASRGSRDREARPASTRWRRTRGASASRDLRELGALGLASVQRMIQVRSARWTSRTRRDRSRSTCRGAGLQMALLPATIGKAEARVFGAALIAANQMSQQDTSRASCRGRPDTAVGSGRPRRTGRVVRGDRWADPRQSCNERAPPRGGAVGNARASCTTRHGPRRSSPPASYDFPLYAVTQISLSETYHLPAIGADEPRASRSPRTTTRSRSRACLGAERYELKFTLETLAESSKRGTALEGITGGTVSGRAHPGHRGCARHAEQALTFTGTAMRRRRDQSDDHASATCRDRAAREAARARQHRDPRTRRLQRDGNA